MRPRCEDKKRSFNKTPKKMFWPVIALGLLCFNTLASTTYYVSSTDGLDSNLGTSPTHPWKTIQRVNKSVFNPGDQVLFKTGDSFAGQLVVNASGLAGRPISYSSYGDQELPILDGSAGNRGHPVSTISIINHDYLKISNLKIRNFRKKSLKGFSNFDAFGIYVQNTGIRDLRGFQFHDLVVEDVFPIRGRNKHKENAFNQVTVTGIRFETSRSTSREDAVHTRDIFIHNNLIRRTGRFGIAVRHRPSEDVAARESIKDYDANFIVKDNRCEDVGGSCVLMSGVKRGLLEGNQFIRSGALVEPNLSVNRGSGAWFWRSRDIVAQHNVSVSSRGHNDSSGIHVDYNNQNILVQYNFFYDNEGDGTEILGNNQNIIWRYNVSVGDGKRRLGIRRPEGGKSRHPGKTINISPFAVPFPVPSEDIYIYNNTYVITANTEPDIRITGKKVRIWNNLFVAQKNATLGQKTNFEWCGTPLDMIGNFFVGNVSENFSKLDKRPHFPEINFDENFGGPETLALELRYAVNEEQVEHPLFPYAKRGIFSHITSIPDVDFFGNTLESATGLVGAGYKKSNP